jgi:hypothetical protein
MPSIPSPARAEFSLEARLLADRFVQWTLAAGRPVSHRVAADIASLVLERAHWFAKPVHHWRSADVYRSLRSTVHNWYALERPGVTEPDDLPEVLWRWFDFLDAEGLLHPDSASVAELHEALRCLYFGLGADGRLARAAPRAG